MKKLVIVPFIIACTAVQVLAFSSPPPAPKTSGPINSMFDRFVAVGDSLSHGAQSMCIDETRQAKSYLALLAAQVNATFIQPLLKFPGFFINIEDLGKGNIKWYEYIIPLTGGRRVDNYGNQSRLNNYAVSGATVADVLYTRGDSGLYSLPRMVLGSSGAPQIDQALSRRPTFVAAWIGGNDVLSCALNTDMSRITPFDLFLRDYTEMARRIISTTSVRGVMTATIPDCSSIAYLQPANDPDVPAGSKKAFWNTNVGGGDEVLDPGELTALTQETVRMNDEIERISAANGWVLADAFTIIRDISMFGYNLRNARGVETGRMISANYLGGLFSLDGFHPSITGHAIIANYFIEEINARYRLNIAMVDEYAASQNDSLYRSPYDPRRVINSWFGQAVQYFVEMFI